MANPQKEDGFTGISNELLEAIVSTKLNGTEYAVVLHVLRKTYGYSKKEDWISYTAFEKATRRTRPNVWKAIESLVTKKILVTKKKLGVTIYSLNKDYSLWVVTKTKLVTKKKLGSYEKEMEVVTKTKPTKETITKETITKEKENAVFDVVSYFGERTGRLCRLTGKKSSQVEARLKVFTVEELKRAIDARFESSWHMGGNDGGKVWAYDWDSLFRNDQKVESALNQVIVKDEAYYQREMERLGVPKFESKYGKELAMAYIRFSKI